MKKSQREIAAMAKLQKTHARNTFKKITQELGARNITLNDIASGEKPDGFLALIKDTGATLDEMVVLQQYAKAITDKDTRAAEFLRDSAGDKPSTTVDLNETGRSGLSQMSLEELKELRDLLVKKK